MCVCVPVCSMPHPGVGQPAYLATNNQLWLVLNPFPSVLLPKRSGWPLLVEWCVDNWAPWSLYPTHETDKTFKHRPKIVRFCCAQGDLTPHCCGVNGKVDKLWAADLSWLDSVKKPPSFVRFKFLPNLLTKERENLALSCQRVALYRARTDRCKPLLCNLKKKWKFHCHWAHQAESAIFNQLNAG